MMWIVTYDDEDDDDDHDDHDDDDEYAEDADDEYAGAGGVTSNIVMEI